MGFFGSSSTKPEQPTAAAFLGTFKADSNTMGTPFTEQTVLKIPVDLLSDKPATVVTQAGAALCTVKKGEWDRIQISSPSGEDLCCMIEPISMRDSYCIYGFKPLFPGQKAANEKSDNKKDLYAWGKVYKKNSDSTYRITMATSDKEYQSEADAMYYGIQTTTKGLMMKKGGVDGSGCMLMEPPPESQEKEAATPGPSVADELKKLMDLNNGGGLTAEEFAQAKAKVLAGGGNGAPGVDVAIAPGVDPIFVMAGVAAAFKWEAGWGISISASKVVELAGEIAMFAL